MSKVLDISKHQGSMDFNKAKKAEIQGIILRCAYGGGQDKKFDEFASNAQKCDMPIGAYAFETFHYKSVSPNYKKAKEKALYHVNSVINILKSKNITGFVALDLELESGQTNILNKQQLTDLSNLYMDKLKQAGYTPVLYCSISWLYDKMLPEKIKYPLWVAYYHTAGYKGTEFPNTKYGDLMRKIKNEIIMWQYSSKGNGHNYGAGSKCIDLNHCYVDFVSTDPKPTPQPKPPVKTPPKNTSKYTVKKGDNLTKIAKDHGILLSYLLRANSQIKNPNLIRVGQQIIIPHKKKITSKTKYTVKKGDTLTAIAKVNGVSLNNLIKANPQIKNPNIIHVGQAINIPLKNSIPKQKSLHVGTKVRVKLNSKTYDGKHIASFVFKNTYTVDQLKGNRAVLDLKGICTPVHVKDLEVV